MGDPDKDTIEGAQVRRTVTCRYAKPRGRASLRKVLRVVDRQIRDTTFGWQASGKMRRATERDMATSPQMLKILVADDSPVYRKLLEHSLSHEDYAILFAKNGREAMDLFTKHRPAVVITDWTMPDISGLELCQRIRRDSKDSYVHVILLTSNADKEEVVEGLAAGADDYLTKPFHSGELQARVRVGRRIVELHRQVQEKNRQLQERRSPIRSRDCPTGARLTSGRTGSWRPPPGMISLFGW
jgi:PleD family two-component response regulator